jgi:hypothetical protein
LEKEIERKEEMRVHSSDTECYVKRTTSMEHWPVFNDKAGEDRASEQIR